MSGKKPHSGRIEVKPAQQHIAGLRATVGQLWVKACEADGVDPASQFVVFRPDNKFMPFYNNAMQMYLEACRAYECGGYVGLEIIQGRAR